MKNEIEQLNKFVAKYPKSETTGFFDRTQGGDFRAIVLASHGGRAEAASFVAESGAKLVAAARRSGWNLGTAAVVERLCNDAPNSRKFRPGNPGYSSYREALKTAPRA